MRRNGVSAQGLPGVSFACVCPIVTFVCSRACRDIKDMP